MSSAPKREMHITQERHPNSTVVLEPSDGPLDYRLEPANNLVLVIDVEETAEGTSICLSREIVLEVAGSPPLGEALNCEQWLVQGMYRYGDRNLQFESIAARGTFMLQASEEDGAYHGQLNITFHDPRIDLLGVREALLDLVF